MWFAAAFCGTYLTVSYALYFAVPPLTQTFPHIARWSMEYAYLVLLLLWSPPLIMRFHDINASGWWTVAFWLVVGGGTVGAVLDEAVLLVLATLVLLVILPGNPRPNRYGAPRQWAVR